MLLRKKIKSPGVASCGMGGGGGGVLPYGVVLLSPRAPFPKKKALLCLEFDALNNLLETLTCPRGRRRGRR